VTTRLQNIVSRVVGLTEAVASERDPRADLHPSRRCGRRWLTKERRRDHPAEVQRVEVIERIEDLTIAPYRMQIGCGEKVGSGTISHASLWIGASSSGISLAVGDSQSAGSQFDSEAAHHS
jgi:hypothetical protein